MKTSRMEGSFQMIPESATIPMDNKRATAARDARSADGCRFTHGAINITATAVIASIATMM